ncbi:MAG: thiamine-phosphate kinase [Roseibium sp.]
MAETRPSEFELIKRYFAPLASDPGSVGLTDDAAVISPREGYDLVLTKDVLAADIHFFANDAPEAIAAKALRVNLSDLAAKGAAPRGYLLGLALPSDWTAQWLERFCNALAADQTAYDVKLLGGDTIRSGNGLQVSITAIGEVPTGRTVRRSGSKAGDIVFVTGTIGDASAGLKARLDAGFSARHNLTSEQEAYILDRYLLPRPRTRLASALQTYASASMDVSDGLTSDCEHMARASNMDFTLELGQIPLSPALQQLKSACQQDFMHCINGGDDYEILATVPAETADEFSNAAAALKCPVTRIGHVDSGAGDARLSNFGTTVELSPGGGFKHF